MTFEFRDKRLLKSGEDQPRPFYATHLWRLIYFSILIQILGCLAEAKMPLKSLVNTARC